MSILLKQLFALIKLLNSETGEKQIAMGIALGMFMGFSPVFSLQTLAVFICLFLFRIQIGAALLGAFVFQIISFLLDPLFHSLGSSLLELQALSSVYTALYNMPLLPYTRFYNSIVMGALVVSLILFPFVFWASLRLVQRYRQTVLTKIKDTRLYKATKLSSFYKWYEKYDRLYGGRA